MDDIAFHESATPSRRILVIRHHVEDDAGLVGDALAGLGYGLVTIMIDPANPAPPRIEWNVAGVVVLGSNASVYDPGVLDGWLSGELALLREFDRLSVPIFGICFGAQVLCHLFGGRVARANEAEVGWTQIEVAPGVAVSDGPWFEYHHDECLLPSAATIWARSSRAVQAFAIGRHVGVQFHPEIDDEQLARWFASESPEARAHDEHQIALLDETRRQTPSARERVRDLVALVVAHGLSLVHDQSEAVR